MIKLKDLIIEEDTFNTFKAKYLKMANQDKKNKIYITKTNLPKMNKDGKRKYGELLKWMEDNYD